jgi:hypothetical protein
MKTVVISRNEKELARVPLNRKSVLAGRSPNCEAVVRYKGVKPIQFMIEHVSENLSEDSDAVDFEAGFWTLIDVSEGTSSGAGIVLDENRQNFNGFDFKIILDTLFETDLKKGVISRSVDKSAVAEGQDKSVVEVVYFRKDIDIITNISHLSRFKTSRRIKLFPQLPNFIFEWQNGTDVKAIIKSDVTNEPFEIFKRGERITQDFIETKKLDIQNQDVIHISTSNNDFYLRLVPAVDVKLEKFSWAKDYLVRSLFAIFCLLITLLFLLKNYTPLPEPAPVVPRVIRLKLPQPSVPLQQVNEPEPPVVVETEEKIPEQIQPSQTTEVTTEAKEVDPKAETVVTKEVKKPLQKAAQQAKPINADLEGKAKVGIKNNAKPKDVNTMGLLAKLKNNNSSNSKQKVTADTVLNQGIVSETMTGEKGRVVVTKAPSGTVGRNTQPLNNNSLASASSTLSGASTADPKTSGALGIPGGTGKFSTGTQLKGLKANGVPGGTDSMTTDDSAQSNGTGFERSEIIQAVGGLDKDAVRKALRENRRAIANCYETALLTRKQLDGRMTFRWVISIEGDVTSIKLQSSEVNMPNFEACVESVIKSIKFPQAPNKITTTVIYPFAFQGKK